MIEAGSCIDVEFCLAQTHFQMQRSLREYEGTVVHLQHGNAPLVHSDHMHGHTCIVLHRGRMEAESLVIPIVGGN